MVLFYGIYRPPQLVLTTLELLPFPRLNLPPLEWAFGCSGDRNNRSRSRLFRYRDQLFMPIETFKNASLPRCPGYKKSLHSEVVLFFFFSHYNILLAIILAIHVDFI